MGWPFSVGGCVSRTPTRPLCLAVACVRTLHEVSALLTGPQGEGAFMASCSEVDTVSESCYNVYDRIVPVLRASEQRRRWRWRSTG
jgi:hypothetical protein